MCQFPGKTDNFDFFVLNLPETDSRLEIEKTKLCILTQNLHPRNTISANFHEKLTALTLLV